MTEPEATTSFDLSEGSTIHALALNLGITPTELLAAPPNEIEFMWHKFFTEREFFLGSLSTKELIAECRKVDERRGK